MKKTVACILFLGFTITGFSQSNKFKEKAIEIVKNLDTEIVSIDQSLALTDTQKIEIQNIQFNRLKELKTAIKNGDDESTKKEINKKHYQKIFRGVLTKQQIQALRKAKDKG